MKIFLLLLAAGVSIWFIIEKKLNDYYLSTFQAVIHVNGIRGKTSTCRLIDAVLRTRYKVYTKTTGTDAMVIHVSGEETPVKRLGPANIHEQLRMIRRAYKEGAQVLILECMAVRPELQKIAQEQIVKSGITVITNVRYDHIFEMGETLDEIASSLSCTVPDHGTLYSSDKDYASFFQEKCCQKGSSFVLCRPEDGEDENTAIAREIGLSLQILPKDIRLGLSKVIQDFGTRQIYPLKNPGGKTIYFYNLFSVNDPMSTIQNLEEVRQEYGEIYFVYNHRTDRPDRALLFARYFFPNYKNHCLFLMGRGCNLAKRLFTPCGLKSIVPAASWQQCLDIPEGSLLVGLGNIKGPGYEMIEKIEKGETCHE